MSRFSAETRAKIKTAAVVLIGLANIAIEAWNIVKTVERCEDLEDDIEDAIRKAEDAKDGAEQLKAEVQEIETNFTITYTDLVAQLYTDAVEEYLVNIQSYASASADYSTSMAARVATIQAYIDGIDAAASSNKDDVITLITNLNSALGELGNSLICYEAKYNTLNYVVESCQAGSSKTLAKLFDDKNGTVNELCKDDGYLAQEDIVEIATLKLTNLSYATECIANSEIASNNICGAWRTGKSNSEIVSEYGYSLTAVEIVVAKCAEGEVTDEIKEAICELRSAARTLTYVHELYEHYIDAEVTSAFEACAPPALSDQDKEDICALKYSKALEYVKSLYELYDPTEVETVYTECVVAEISTAHKAALCSLKKLAATGYNTSSFLATYHNLYGEAAVTAYFSSIDADTCSTTASDTMEEDHYHKSSPSQSFDVDLNDLQALSKVNSQHDEVQNKELTKERKMEIFADVLNEFPDDKKQRLKDIIKEEIETRRQRILKKLKDRLGH